MIIQSMPTTPAYRKGWDRIFGEKKTGQYRPHWYKIYACFTCGGEVSRERVYGRKPATRTVVTAATRCSQCQDMPYKISPRFA